MLFFLNLFQAASRHNCPRLINLHKDEFLTACQVQKEAGGVRRNSFNAANRPNRSWVKGLDQCTEKMRKLDRINRLIAHRPWSITPEIIKVITNELLSWSIPRTAVTNMFTCAGVDKLSGGWRDKDWAEVQIRWGDAGCRDFCAHPRSVIFHTRLWKLPGAEGDGQK